MSDHKLNAKQYQELGQAEFDNLCATGGITSSGYNQAQRAMQAFFKFGYTRAKEEAANEARLYFENTNLPYGKELALNIEALECT